MKAKLKKKSMEKAKRKRQSGTLAFLSRNGSLRIMLVTPRFSGDGWIIPKGNVERGMSSGDSAEKEAFEEAGIEGVRSRRPAGFYTFRKKGADCKVAVFLMRVERVFPDWLEKLERKRKLFKLEDARKALKNRRLVELAGRLPELAKDL